MSTYEFKAGDRFKGASSVKCFKALCACEFLVTSGKQVMQEDKIAPSFSAAAVASSRCLRAIPKLRKLLLLVSFASICVRCRAENKSLKEWGKAPVKR